MLVSRYRHAYPARPIGNAAASSPTTAAAASPNHEHARALPIDLGREIACLAARKAALEPLSEQAPTLPADRDLPNLLTRIALAVAEAAPEQHKLLRDAVVVRITVESRAVIKP
jgi:hypothetical protein